MARTTPGTPRPLASVWGEASVGCVGRVLGHSLEGRIEKRKIKTEALPGELSQISFRLKEVLMDKFF